MGVNSYMHRHLCKNDSLTIQNAEVMCRTLGYTLDNYHFVIMGELMCYMMFSLFSMQ